MKRLFLTLILSTGFAGAASAVAQENSTFTPENVSGLTGHATQALSPEEDGGSGDRKRQLLFQMLSQTYDGALSAAGQESGVVRLKNDTAIYSLTPQDVSFEGADGCRYFGTTRNPDDRGGILLNVSICGKQLSNIRARAYMTILRRQSPEATVQAMIPVGSSWVLSPGSGTGRDPAAQYGGK